MKRLLLKRVFRAEEYTIGRLSIDGAYFCDTLEDRVRDLSHEAKVSGQTAVPAGVYTVTLTQSPRFGRVLPELHNVPHFTAIRIHAGNSAADTMGCILVGENSVKGRLVNSRLWESRLVERLEGDEAICITIEES